MTFSASWNVSMPQIAAVKNIDVDYDITDIVLSEISANIDIGKGDIDPALIQRRSAHPDDALSPSVFAAIGRRSTANI